jgi:6-phosphogluconolactonase
MKPVTLGRCSTPASLSFGRIKGWVLPDAAQVALAASRLIVALAADAISHRGRFRLVLAGGRTPVATYHQLAGQPTDWDKWELYFGDERCLPADHAERNSQMAERVLLSRIPLAADRVHPIPAELGAEVAAASYARLMAMVVPFDLVLLGVGEDGHTASLFPGRAWDLGAWMVPIHDAPKPPPDRVSLGIKALQSAHHLLVLATGVAKREALRGWLTGEDLPIARVCQDQSVILLLDEDAKPCTK